MRPPSRTARTLPFDGAVNFRQLGGYRASDGRRVRWAKLFRSEHLGFLSEADLDRLDAMQLGCVCDLRSARERLANPDRLPRQKDIRVVHLEIDQSALVSPPTAERLCRPEATAEDVADGMRESYRRMVSHCAAQFAAFMGLLLEATNLPLLVHCTGGKDRSGFAAAILLRALGVPRRTVFHDYLLTNKAIARSGEGYSAELSHSLRLREEQGPFAPLFVADRLYLKESFVEIDRLYGSFDRYLRRALEVSDQQRDRLRDALLA